MREIDLFDINRPRAGEIWTAIAIGLIGGSVFRCWLASIAWGWFIVPVFKAPPLRPLTIFALGGLMAIVLPQFTDGTKPTKFWERRETLWAAAARPFYTSAAVFGILWLIHKYQ